MPSNLALPQVEYCRGTTPSKVASLPKGCAVADGRHAMQMRQPIYESGQDFQHRRQAPQRDKRFVADTECSAGHITP
jgi:hypothetical protein